LADLNFFKDAKVKGYAYKFCDWLIWIFLKEAGVKGYAYKVCDWVIWIFFNGFIDKLKCPIAQVPLQLSN
jgi:hypothetical protein